MLKDRNKWNKCIVICMAIFLSDLLNTTCFVYAGETMENSQTGYLESEQEDSTIVVNDLDLGNYNTEMKVGEKQLLQVTLLPIGAENETIYYVSSHEEVATINAMGRISAIGSGKTKISVQCGDVERFFTLTVEEEEIIEVEDLDMGTYKEEMLVGEQQVLNITPIPLEVANTKVRYLSSDEEVATINALGRIIAKNEGRTTITVKCGNVERDFKLKVSEKENIKVSDLDIGIYKEEMTIGDTQMLNITVIPSNATKKDIKFTSSNEDVARINAIGRIFAVGEGKCKITVSSGGKKKSFRLEVKKKVVVSDIEIGEYEDELIVDKRMTLKVKAIPEEAVDRKITFESSDKKIATVTSDGEIVGVSKGKVTILIKAGDIKKKIDLTVKIATERINVNSTYLVMKKGETFQLDTTIYPEEATQEVAYKCANTEIASVTTDGKVKAKKLGNTSIIVSNGDLSKVVTVIVNEQGGKINDSPNFVSIIENKEKEALSPIEKALIDRMEYHSTVEILSDECNIISKPILKKLLETHSTLTIDDEKYQIIIEGKNIVNYENELKTDIAVNDISNNKEFIINDKNKLPGKIMVNFKEDPFQYRYLYLLNNDTDNYQLLISENDLSNTLEIDEFGKYMLTSEKIDKLNLDKKVLFGVGGAISLGVIVFCLIKKRYWFW